MKLVIFVFIYFLTTTEAAPCKNNQQCSSCYNDGRCLSECFRGYYGYQCKHRCSPGCKHDVCKLTNSGEGICMHGCKLGVYGTRCNIPCETHVNTCRKCPKECEGGFCQLGWSCARGCQDSYYGTACRSCPAGCEVCNRVSGTCEVCFHCEGDCTHGCLGGCTTGYFGDFCERTCNSGCLKGCNQTSGDCFGCKSGLFGPTCDKQCPNKCLDEECDTEGNCTHGCIGGWHGPQCESKCTAECAGGRCGRNGKCIDGCKLGFHGEQCDKQCPNKCLVEECGTEGNCTHGCIGGWHGPQCESKCTAECAGGRCGRNGTCIDGCKLGFHGEQCQNQCPPFCFNKLCAIEDASCRSCEKGYHGRHCNQSCWRCVDASCTQNIGHCIHGCLSNYRGEFCQHDCAGKCTTDECRDVCNTNILSGQDYMPYWVAAAVVLIVAVLVIYAACRFKRLQRVIYGSMKGEQRQEHQPQRDQTEEPAEPTVHFYCEVDEGVMTPARLPRVCAAQVALTRNTALPETSSQSRQDANQDGRSNSPKPVSSNTDAPEQKYDAPVHSEEAEGDVANARSVQGMQSNRNSYLTAFAPIGEGFDASRLKRQI